VALFSISISTSSSRSLPKNISFSTKNVGDPKTPFSTASEVRAAIEECPLEKLLLETDSPYLAPVPLRGQINEPANIIHTGRLIAEIKSLTEQEVATATTQNAERFYRLTEIN